MSYKRHDGNYLIYIINILFGSSMILYELLPPALVAALSFVVYIYDYMYFRTKYEKNYSLFLTSILFLPVSFVSVLGTDYSMLPITFFSISLILIFMNSILENKILKRYLILTAAFLCFSVISLVLYSNYILSAISQLLMLLLFFIAFQDGEYLRWKNKDIGLDEMCNMYICAVFSFALQVLLQKAWISMTGEAIGHYAEMGQGRIAYAGLMGDWSFASLFLASGAVMMLIRHTLHKKISLIGFTLITLFFLFVSIIVSARTGLVSFIICYILFSIFNFKKSSKKLVVLLIPAILALPSLFNMMIESRGGLDLALDGSGRIEAITESLDTIKEHWLFGVGFGSMKLTNDYNIVTPHNFFVQYLLQFGIVGLSIILILIAPLFFRFAKGNSLIWLFIVVFIGAMLVPDIISSRFLSVIVMMIIINQGKEKTHYAKK